MNEHTVRGSSQTSHTSRFQTHEPSTAGLIRQLANEVSTLFSKEVALAKAEVNEAIDDAKKGSISMVAGASVLYAGVLFLLGAAVIGLAQVVELWLAALIVGGVTALVGLIMVQSGKKKLEAGSFKPERTIHSMEKDQRAIRGAAS